MAPEIRLARPDERAALEALQRRASLEASDYRAQLEAHPDAIHLPAEQIAAGRVLVAEDDSGAPAGFAVWLDGATPGEAELDGLFVEPGQWRGGYGRALIAAVAASATGRGRLTVIANPAALAFYRSCGFVHAGEAETRFGPAPLMVRPLG